MGFLIKCLRLLCDNRSVKNMNEKFNRIKNDDRGETLIEILISVCIFAVCISIFVSSISVVTRSISSSQTSGYALNLSQQTYYGDGTGGVISNAVGDIIEPDELRLTNNGNFNVNVSVIGDETYTGTFEASKVQSEKGYALHGFKTSYDDLVLEGASGYEFLNYYADRFMTPLDVNATVAVGTAKNDAIAKLPVDGYAHIRDSVTGEEAFVRVCFAWGCDTYDSSVYNTFTCRATVTLKYMADEVYGVTYPGIDGSITISNVVFLEYCRKVGSEYEPFNSVINVAMGTPFADVVEIGYVDMDGDGSFEGLPGSGFAKIEDEGAIVYCPVDFNSWEANGYSVRVPVSSVANAKEIVFTGGVADSNEAKYREILKGMVMTIRVLTSEAQPMLMNGIESSPDAMWLRTDLTKDSIGSITFENHAIPSGIGSVDVSYNEDGSVIAWWDDADGDGLYDVHIGGNGAVCSADCSYLFANLVNCKSIDFNGAFNPVYAESMKGMFKNCTSLKSVTFDSNFAMTQECTDLSDMFLNCASLESANVDNLRTAMVTDMSGIFKGCSSLKDVSVSSWNTGAVTDYEEAFFGCSSLEHIGISGWSVGNAETMTSFFEGCSSLTGVDLSKWDVAKVESFENFMKGCSSIDSIATLSNWTPSSLKNASGMFEDCVLLDTVRLPGWQNHLGNLEDMSRMFSGCSNLQNISAYGWDVSGLKNADYAFAGTGISSCYVSDWDTSKLESAIGMFEGCSNLLSIDMSDWELGSCKDISGMFKNCGSLKTVLMTNCDGNEAGMQMNSIFSGCNSLEEVDMSSMKYLSVVNGALGYSIADNFSNDCIFYVRDSEARETVRQSVGADEQWKKDNVLTKASIGGYYEDASLETELSFRINATEDILSAEDALKYAQKEFETVYLKALPLYNSDKEEAAEGTITWNSSRVNAAGYKLVGTVSASEYSLMGNVTVTLYIYKDGVLSTYDCMLTNKGLESVTSANAYFLNTKIKRGLIRSVSFFDYSDAPEDADGTYDVSYLGDGTVSLWYYIDSATGLYDINIGGEGIVRVYPLDNKGRYSMSYFFAYMENLVSVDGFECLDIEGDVYFNYTFYKCAKLKTLDLSGLVFGRSGNIVRMESTFRECVSLETLDFASWNFSNVFKFSYAFARTLSLKEIIGMDNIRFVGVADFSYAFWDCGVTDFSFVSSWDFSKNKEFLFLTAAFKGCSCQKDLDLSGWNAYIGYSCNEAFAYSKFRNINLRGLNMGMVSSAQNCFSNTPNLEIVDFRIDDGNLRRCTKLANLFYRSAVGEIIGLEDIRCSSYLESLWYCFSDTPNLKIVDLRGFNGNVFVSLTSASNMFAKSGVEEVYLGGEIARSGVKLTNMFDGCGNLRLCDMSGFLGKGNYVYNMSAMFNKCTALKCVEFGDVKAGSNNVVNMFNTCVALEYVDMSGINMSEVTDANSMFYNCSVLELIDGMEEWQFSNNLSKTSKMFNWCSRLRAVDFSGCDFSGVGSCSAWFDKCISLEEIKGGIYDVCCDDGKMAYSIFYNCRLLEKIEGIETWDMSGASACNGVFFNCASLTGLDLSQWGISSKCTDVTNIFRRCSKLETVNISGWDISGVTAKTGISGMFAECASLKDIVGLEELRLGEAITEVGTASMFAGAGKDNSERVLDINLSSLYSDVSFYSLYNGTRPSCDTIWMFEDAFVRDVDISSFDFVRTDIIKYSGALGGYDKTTTVRNLYVMNDDNRDYFKNGLRGLIADNYYIRVKCLDIYGDKELVLPVEKTLYFREGIGVSELREMYDGKKITAFLKLKPKFDYHHQARAVSKEAEFTLSDFVDNGDGTYSLTATTEGNIVDYYVLDEPCSFTVTLCPVPVPEDVNFLMDQSYVVTDNGDIGFLRFNNIKRVKVSTIRFLSSGDAPDGAIVCDASLFMDGSIQAWAVPASTAGYYDVTICGKNMAFYSAKKFFVCLGNATSISGLELVSLEYVDGLSSLFSNCRKLVELSGHENWDVSKLTDFSYTFYGTSGLEDFSFLNKWDFSNGIYFEGTFSCSGISGDIDLTLHPSLQSVYSVKGMFRECKNITSVDLSGWDFSQVTTCAKMFYKCTSLKYVNFGSGVIAENTPGSAALSCESMFEGDVQLEKIDGLNIGKRVTTILSIFDGCIKLGSLDVSGWDMSGMYDISYAFRDCSSIKALDFSESVSSKYLSKLTGAFSGMTGCAYLDVSGWNVSNCKKLDGTFYSLGSAVSGADVEIRGLDTWSLGTAGLSSLDSAFAYVGALADNVVLDVSLWNVDGVTSMSKAFLGVGCNAKGTVDIGDLRKWRLSSSVIIGIDSAFEDFAKNASYRAASLQVGGDTNDVVNVKNISGTFKGINATALGGVFDISNFDVESGGGDLDDGFTNNGTISKIYIRNKDVYGVLTGNNYHADVKEFFRIKADFEGSYNKSSNGTYTSATYAIEIKKGQEAEIVDILEEIYVDCYAKLLGQKDGTVYYEKADLEWYKVEQSEQGYKAYAHINLPVLWELSAVSDVVAEVTVSSSGVPVLMSGSNKGATQGWLTTPVAKNKIESVEFTVSTDIPANALHVSDVSYNSDGGVTAYFLDANGNGLYEAYVCGDETGLMLNTDDNGGGCWLFSNMTQLKSVSGMEYVDSSGVTNFSSMFYNCTALKDVSGLGSLDFSDCVSVENMFYGCSSLNSLGDVDVSNWDTSKVIDYSGMFYGCEALSQISGIENIDMTSAESVCEMFYNCKKLTNADMRGWVVGNKLQDMSYVCYGCESLQAINFKGVDLSAVVNMSYSFANCRSLVTADFSNVDFSSLADMSHMFDGCASVEKFDFSETADTSSPLLTGMFDGCVSVKELDITGFSFPVSSYIDGLFDDLPDTPEALSVVYVRNSHIRNEVIEYKKDGNSASLWSEDNVVLRGEVLNVYDSPDSLELFEPKIMVSKSLVTDSATAAEKIVNVMNSSYGSCYVKIASIYDGSSETVGRDGVRVEWDSKTVVLNGDGTYSVEGTVSAVSGYVLDKQYAVCAVVIPSGSLLGSNINRTTATGSWFNTSLLRNQIGSITILDSNVVPADVEEGCSADISRDSTGAVMAWWYKNDATGYYDVFMGGDGTVYTNSDTNGGCAHLFSFLVNCKSITGFEHLNTSMSVNMDNMFESCSALGSVDLSTLDTVSVVGMKNMFYNCSELKSIGDVSGWKTSNVKDFAFMFSGCAKLADVDAGKWDMSKAVSIQRMFNDCESLVSVGDWRNKKLANVEDMVGAWCNCYSLAQLDTREWLVGSIVSLDSAFYNCKALSSMDMSDWDVKQLTDLDNTWRGCSSLVSVNLKGWSTASLNSMFCAFEGCTRLTGIEGVGELDVSLVQNMNSVFKDCVSIAELPIGDWRPSSLATITNGFFGCISLKSLDLSQWDTSSLTNIEYLFNGCLLLESIDLSGWKVENVRSMLGVFSGCASLKSLDLSAWELRNCESLSYTWYGCMALEALDISTWTSDVLSNTTNLSCAFFGCSVLEYKEIGGSKFELSKLATAKVSDFSGMFNGCKKLSLDWVGDWNVSSATNFSGMFNGCTGVSGTVDLSAWETNGNLVTMENMFNGCSNISAILMPSLGVGSVKTIESMCSGCSSLSEIDISGWEPAALENMGAAFAGSDITEIDLSKWAASSIKDYSRAFESCGELKTVIMPKCLYRADINFEKCFSGVSDMEIIDMSHVEFGNGMNCKEMFNGCNRGIVYVRDDDAADFVLGTLMSGTDYPVDWGRDNVLVKGSVEGIYKDGEGLEEYDAVATVSESLSQEQILEFLNINMGVCYVKVIPEGNSDVSFVVEASVVWKSLNADSASVMTAYGSLIVPGYELKNEENSITSITCTVNME